MCDLLDDLFPAGMSHTTPIGGMFMLATLPEGLDSMKLFEAGIKGGVAVLPGTPFYVTGGGQSTIRLNFSSMDEARIFEGMERLAKVVRSLL
jgi:2-aminoadipate transaminase